MIDRYYTNYKGEPTLAPNDLSRVVAKTPDSSIVFSEACRCTSKLCGESGYRVRYCLQAENFSTIEAAMVAFLSAIAHQRQCEGLT